MLIDYEEMIKPKEVKEEPEELVNIHDKPLETIPEKEINFEPEFSERLHEVQQHERYYEHDSRFRQDYPRSPYERQHEPRQEYRQEYRQDYRPEYRPEYRQEFRTTQHSY